jgi:hypothetical protein
MRFNKVQKEILKGLIKGKGYYKTPKVPKDTNDKMLNDMLPLYFSNLIVFQREYNVPFIGPINEHKVTHKHYVITMNRKVDLKQLKKVLKDGINEKK